MNQVHIEDFILQEKDTYIEIKLEVEELTLETEQKLIELLHTAYFAVKNDLQINLEDIKHISPTTLLRILEFATEMKKESRNTSLVFAPRSIQFFIHRFGFSDLLKVL